MRTFLKALFNTLPIQAMVFFFAVAAQATITVTPPDDLTFPMFGTVACKAYNCFLGSDTILVFSALAIFSMGVMVMLGKVQWNTVLLITIGMSVLGGAAVIVNQMNSNPIGVGGVIGLGANNGVEGCDRAFLTSCR